MEIGNVMEEQKMRRKNILKKGLVCGMILLFIGAGVIPSVIAFSEQKCFSANAFPPDHDENQLLPDRPYWIVGKITGLHQEGDLIVFYAIKVFLITFRYFTLKTYENGEIKVGKNYIGIITPNWICAWCPHVELDHPPQKLPGKKLPETMIGSITNLNTSGTLRFTAKKTWYILSDPLTIDMYPEGFPIEITSKIYFKIITPRFVFIIAVEIPKPNLQN